MINDGFKLRGDVLLVLTDENGLEKDRREIKNLVVTTGKNFVASRMAGTSSGVMTHMAVGTNNTAAAAGDTTLNTELARVALNVSGGTVTTNTVQYVAAYPAGTGTGALVEAGVFNASSNGTMLCRTVFSTVNKGASDTLTIYWTITAG